VHSQTDHDARRSAAREARFAATAAAKQLGEAIAAARASVAELAGSPQIGQVYAQPKGCSLSYSGLGGADSGHIDLLTRTGAVLCSSRPVPKGRPAWSYTQQPWLARARERPVLLAPVHDPATGRSAVIAAAPIPGHGVAIAVLDLAPVGPALVALYGGPTPTEFLITDTTSKTVVARSKDPGRWVGASLAGGRFATTRGAFEQPDLDGKARLYQEVAVPGVAWNFYAGVDRAAVFASASHLQNRQIGILLAGFAAMLLAVLLTYHRVARPISRLSSAVRSAAADGSEGDVRSSGPTQVRALADEINGFTASIQRELTARQSAEEAADASERNYRLVFEGSPQPMYLYDFDTLALLDANAAALAHYGYSYEEFVALTIRDIVSPELRVAIDEIRADGSAPRLERAGPFKHVRKDGTKVDVRITAHSVDFGGRHARFILLEDVGQKEHLERQLRQSQRLESLGQLAGGVAHDFNNLLGVILNCAAFSKEEITAGKDGADPDWATMAEDMDEIEGAAGRGATLTRQLLAFARREVVSPALIDVNEVITGLESLLRRTLGEHIELGIALRDDLWPVLIDPGQFEQILVNLAVNARDAMPAGGHLAIDSENIEVDEHYAATSPGVPLGRYVRLRVTDTGSGIDDETLERVFEPFFTTKPQGKGTGLGLATIYGIVTQAGGRARIYSEVGVGTTFTALLPAPGDRSDAAPANTPAGGGSGREVPAATTRGDGETILLVEDEDPLRLVTSRMLRRNGYQVLLAADGPEALDAESDYGEPIALLITDVIMPNMSGKELAERILDRRPDIRELFISGYAHPVLDALGQIAGGAALVEKPYTEAALLTAIRQLLDAPAPVAS
jgi:PAS domain S-box-containing protein